MKKNIDTVIFDMDGTVLDTLEDLKEALNFALRTYDMPERTLAEVRAFVGNGARRLLELSVPEGRLNPLYEQVYAKFREYYDLHCNDNTKAYEGILPLLKKLEKEGYALAIVSNKLDAAVKELNDIYFEGIVKTAIGEVEGIARKPAPDMVEKALKELGKTRETAVYVGDSEVDLMTAENAGLPCISVLWGFREKPFLEEHGAQWIAETPQDVIRLVQQMQQA